jgi:hypothetical protein
MRIFIFMGSICLMSLSASLFSANALKRPPEGIANPAPKKRMKGSENITFKPAEEIRSFDDVKVCDLIAENGATIVFVDIDGTLMRNALWFDNLHDDDKGELIDDFYLSSQSKVISRDHALFREFLLNRDLNDLAQVLVDNSAPALLAKLKESGAIIVALTARHSQISEETKAELLSLGIDFAKLSGMDKTEFKGVGEGAGFIDGIYYTNFHGNQYLKAQVIVGLTNRIQKKLGLKGPFKIGHLDDNIEEIDAFKEMDTLCTIYTFYPASKDEMVITPYHCCAHDKLRDRATEERTEIYQELNSLYINYLEINQK